MGELIEGRFRWLAAAIALFCGLLTVRAGRSAGFIDDDIASLGFGKRYGFGSETFIGLAETRDHILPGAAATNKLLSFIGPHWWQAQLLTALLVALLVFAVAILVRELCGSASVALFVAFAVGASVVIGRIALWWTASSIHLPLLILSVLVIWLALRWWKRPSAWLLIATFVVQLAAASFSDRAMLVAPLVWAVMALMEPTDAPLARQLLERTRRAAPLLVALFAVVALQIGVTLSLANETVSPGLEAASSLSSGGWLEALANWWGRGVAGVLANEFPVPSYSADWSASLLHSTAFAILLVGCAVLAALLWASCRRPVAALAWVALFLLVTASGLQIVAGRIGSIGPVGIASIARYQDVTLLGLAVLVPLAWAVSGRPRPPVGATVGATLVVALCLVWLVQLRAGVKEVLDRPIAAAQYARNLRATLPDAGVRSYTLLDDRLPPYVMGRVPQTASFSWLSSAIEVLDPGATLPRIDSPNGAAFIVDPDGNAVPVVEEQRASVPRSGLDCLSTEPGSRWLDGSVRLDIPVSRSAHRSGRPIIVDVALTRSSAQGEVGISPLGAEVPLRTIALARHRDGFRVLIPAGSVAAAVDFWGGARTCVESASTSAAVRAGS